MADGRSTATYVVQWSTLFAVLAAVAGTVGRFAPLTSPRPDEGGATGARGIGDQGADARLWQDPFQAA
ncbi:MAG: hypothetical protein JWO31_3763, partial [Phycisphaerales bacterium]|nr:hypothetical protein [Phycisphaerales bacterium]